MVYTGNPLRSLQHIDFKCWLQSVKLHLRGDVPTISRLHFIQVTLKIFDVGFQNTQHTGVQL